MPETKIFANLVERLSDLPGIGKVTAHRLAFHIMKMERSRALALSQAITEVKDRITNCRTCCNMTEQNPCEICSDPKRDHSVICVVENPSDVNAVEKAGMYRGVYHVLGGSVSPLENVAPGDLHIAELMERLDGAVEEVIIATNPTVEGETTATYLADMLKGKVVSVSRIARGLPAGSDLELADKVTLTRSFEGRKVME